VNLRKSRLTSGIALLALLISGCTGRSASGGCTSTDVDLRQSGSLHVGVDLSYPPFAFESEDGEPEGLEVDLLEAVAKEARLELSLRRRTAASLIPELLTHRFDLAASGLRDTDDLRNETCISQPYLGADLALLAPSPDPHSIGDVGDLEGRKVGVVEGSRAADWAREHLGQSTIETLGAPDDLLTAVRERTVDAVIDDEALGRFVQSRSNDLVLVDEIATGESHVLVAHPDNGALIAVVDAALQDMKEDGRLSRLEKKWLG
jgi:ABC-type amino acid transport substrate-binding protein